MFTLKSFKNWVNKLVEFIEDILVPEDVRIKKLLGLEAGMMRELLPVSPVNMEDVFVLFDYNNKIVKFIVKSIKYKNNAAMRKRIAFYLNEEIIGISADVALFEGAPPMLVPMPMGKKEKRKRRFNQCEELCREIEKLNPPADRGGIEVSYNILRKIKETKRQTVLGREERLINVKNSMQAFDSGRNLFFGPTKIKNRAVIILDDVYTTLASFSEARRALKSAGARRVIGLFIAH